MPTLKTRLFAIPIALCIVFSQIYCYDDCYQSFSPEFKQTNWELIALDNSGKEPISLTTNKAPMNAFGLGILYTTYISAYQNNLKCGSEPQHSIYGNLVTNVLITCLQDFDPSHPAGVSLNNYFKELTYTPSTNLPSYTEVSTAGFNKYTKTYREVDFIMVQPPDHPGNYQFKVCLFFDYHPKCDSSFTTPVITLY